MLAEQLASVSGKIIRDEDCVVVVIYDHNRWQIDPNIYTGFECVGVSGNTAHVVYFRCFQLAHPFYPVGLWLFWLRGSCRYE